MLLLAALVSSVVLALAGGAGARADQMPSEPVLTLSVSGRGWGHGVGMSQWGAYGYALRGVAYDQILAHYYPGTQLQTAGGATMRVLVVESAKKLSVGSAGAFKVKDATGETRRLEPGTYELGRALELGDQQLEPPLRFNPGPSPLAVDGVRYRGNVSVTLEKGKLSAIDSVGLEAYLLGVVPRESPHTWPAEALKAQAVAARSYALATRKPAGAFDVYADVRSQVYGGIEAETPETNAAVQATARQALFFGGKVATTYFFSTSGGKTVAVSEAWPGSPQVPYLVSVDDPYDDASPHHTWGPVAVSGRQLKQGLELRSAPVDARTQLGPSGRVSSVVLTLADGSEVTVPSGAVRSAAGLRSTWFRIGGRLSLIPPETLPLTFGTRTRLTGFARGVGPVTLERKPVGGAWEKVTQLPLGKDGSFALPVRGELTTDYRLSTATLKGAVARIKVAPRVTIKPQPGALAGKVRPVAPGVVVVLQRQDGVRWRRVAKAAVDERGAYTADVSLAPGVYRARVAPRKGYAAGVSRAVSVAR